MGNVLHVQVSQRGCHVNGQLQHMNLQAAAIPYMQYNGLWHSACGHAVPPQLIIIIITIIIVVLYQRGGIKGIKGRVWGPTAPHYLTISQSHLSADVRRPSVPLACNTSILSAGKGSQQRGKLPTQAASDHCNRGANRERTLQQHMT